MGFFDLTIYDFVAGGLGLAGILLSALFYKRKKAKLKFNLSSFERRKGVLKLFLEVINKGEDNTTVTDISTSVNGMPAGLEIIGKNSSETTYSRRKVKTKQKFIPFNLPETIKGHESIVLAMYIHMPPMDEDEKDRKVYVGFSHSGYFDFFGATL